MRHLKTPPGTSRHGVTSVLAMMYLILFATLALGFYTSTNSATMVAHNELEQERARNAAETGIYFASYQLSQITMPAATPLDQRFAACGTFLGTQLNGTANLSGGIIYADASVIRIPSDPTQYVKADPNGSEFRLVITPQGQNFRVQSIGRDATGSNGSKLRAVQLDFSLNQIPSQIFNYGVATRGSISTSGGATIKGGADSTTGSILSTSAAVTPISIGGGVVSGDISTVSPTATVSVAGGVSVGGTTDPTQIQTLHVHKGVATPEFPVIDTNSFVPYATNTYVSGKTVYSNTRVPPNTNPSFPAGTTVKGVLYIDTPNKVTFSGSAIVQGVIVVNTNNPVGNLLTNVITFSGGVVAQSVDTLDSSYGALRTMTGVFLLAPGFNVSMSGSFGAINGSIAADKLSMSGSTTATLNGSAIILKDNPLSMSGSATITVNHTGFDLPSGMRFSSRFAPISTTYDEVKAP